MLPFPAEPMEGEPDRFRFQPTAALVPTAVGEKNRVGQCPSPRVHDKRSGTHLGGPGRPAAEGDVKHPQGIGWPHKNGRDGLMLARSLSFPSQRPYELGIVNPNALCGGKGKVGRGLWLSKQPERGRRAGEGEETGEPEAPSARGREVRHGNRGPRDVRMGGGGRRCASTGRIGCRRERGSDLPVVG